MGSNDHQHDSSGTNLEDFLIDFDMMDAEDSDTLSLKTVMPEPEFWKGLQTNSSFLKAKCARGDHYWVFAENKSPSCKFCTVSKYDFELLKKGA